MRIDGRQGSSNIEDRRGAGGVVKAGGGIGVGTLVVFGILWALGADPRQLLGALQQQQQQQQVAPQGDTSVPMGQDAEAKMASVVLRDTEVTWAELFRQSGRRYKEPKLVLFRDRVQSACGLQSAAVGPFYCPADHKAYIDLDFYDALASRFGAPGDFAQAYVLAHEVGHHVQNLLGASAKVAAAKRNRSKAEGNKLSVMLELQADCYAGVWAHHAHTQRQLLERGDVEEGLRAAAAIGDDTLQKKAGGVAVPESFTHGTSAQRVKWFKRGMQKGTIDSCDTFKAMGARL